MDYSYSQREAERISTGCKNTHNRCAHPGTSFINGVAQYCCWTSDGGDVEMRILVAFDLLVWHAPDSVLTTDSTTRRLSGRSRAFYGL